jgi:hypothetical protein
MKGKDKYRMEKRWQCLKRKKMRNELWKLGIDEIRGNK